MIALLLLALGRQSDISADLEQALAGKKLAGPEFHRAIDPVLQKYNALSSARFQRTVGDKRGMIVTLTGSGPNWDETKAWRIFLWPESTKIRAQVIKRFGDFSTSAIDSYTDGEAWFRNDRLVIAGRDYDGTKTSRAGLTSYTLEQAHWKLAQHLASERQGVAVFSRLDQAIDPSRVLVKTRLRPDHFRVPAEGPMLTFSETWLLKEGQYVKGKPTQENTAVAALDTLAGFAQKKDRKSFDALVQTAFSDSLYEALSNNTALIANADKTEADIATTFRISIPNTTITLERAKGKWNVTAVGRM